MTALVQIAKRVDQKSLSGPALRTFFRIAELWRLSVNEQMTLLGACAAENLRQRRIFLPGGPVRGFQPGPPCGRMAGR